MTGRLTHWRTAALCVVLGATTACVGSVENPSGGGPSGTGGPGPGSGNTGSGGASTTPTGSGGSNPGTGSTPGNVGSGGTGGANAPKTARPLELDGHPKYFRFVRLTNEQWGNSVKELLKLSAVPDTSGKFLTPVLGATDFNNNELLLDITSSLWMDYQSASEKLAAQVSATDAAMRAVYSGTQDAATFIQTFGRRVYRRPLTAAEVTGYQKVYTAGAALTGTQSAFTKGAGLVIEAMLQSPFFLYRSEMAAQNAPLSAYEMAAKLSLLLRDSTPNDALLDAAGGTGKYDTADGAASLASTMLEEANAKLVMRRFHDGLLDLETFGHISKQNVPTFTEALNPELAEASFLFFEKLFTQNLGVREMLTSTTGFVGPGLAKLYGVAAPTSGYVERDLGDKRIGFFTQIPYLARFAINGEADPIHRGTHVGIDVLCANPGDAVPNLPPVPPLMPNQTNRERYENLTGGCGGECHNTFINPIGFAFENYDGMGQWRDMQSGKPVNAAGSYPFTEGLKSFSGAADLMRVMSEGEQVHLCYGKKLAGFALQRDLVPTDMATLTALKSASMSQGGSIKKMFLELVKNNAFRTRVGGAQ